MRLSSMRLPALGAVGLLAPGLLLAQPSGNPELFLKSLKAAEQAVEYYGAYDNPEEQRRVAEIGYRIAQETRFDTFPFSFYLIEMPVPNAFALPGGQVFLTRGMLDLDLNDDMLAGLLGHEIGHVVKQHGIRMQRRATLLNVLSQAVLAGVIITADSGGSATGPHPTDPYGRYGGGSRGGGDRVMGAAAAGVVVSELLLRSYSRGFEDEADDEGQRLAAGAGFDPDGTRQLMATMRARLPETQEYGYWRTHPFFDQRVRAAAVREELLKIQEPREADAFREKSQTALLEYAEHPKVEPAGVELLKSAALSAWPRGPIADGLRLERLEPLREAELAKPEVSRDYGRLIEVFELERKTVAELDSGSDLPARLERDIGAFARSRAELYDDAVEVLRVGVYETDFLATFLSNYPDAPEVAEVALELGNAHARLGRQAEAVSQYLRSWSAAPESEEGQRARTGLHNLAPTLDRLEALHELIAQESDAELQQLAAERLAKLASTYRELDNGSSYLKRFPDGPHAEAVNTRLNSLAENLYGELVLYQTVGDHAKALDRIQRILTQAPHSPAAERLREQAVLES